MTTSTQTRVMTVAAALVLAASSAVGGGVADAGAGTGCAPTTRTLATPDRARPLAMSPRGHVVTREQPQSASTSSWLNRPDGTRVRIAFTDGASPYYVRDVNARGAAVGTLNVNLGGTSAGGDAWASRGGHARLLPTPTDGAPTYYAESITGAGAVAGVSTNFPDAMPGDTDFEASAVVWSDRTSLPVTLAMPAGLVVDVPTSGWPIVNLMNSGYVEAVLVDPATSTRYLTRWLSPTGQPFSKVIPAAWVPTDVAGGWIVGRISSTDQGFVASPDVFATISALGDTVGGMRITANGTWMANRYGGTAEGDAVLVGQYLNLPGTTERFVLGADVVGTGSGQLAFSTEGASTTTGVISCAVGLPAPTDVTVTAPAKW